VLKIALGLFAQSFNRILDNTPGLLANFPNVLKRIVHCDSLFVCHVLSSKIYGKGPSRFVGGNNGIPTLQRA
jgi:hypothetical protein